MELSGIGAFFTICKLFGICHASRFQEFGQYSSGGCLEDQIQCDFSSPYRTYDGSCSSLGDSLWGKAGTPFQRTGSPFYQNDIDSPRLAKDGNPLPNARNMSTVLFRDKFAPDHIHTHNVMFWGQLMAHDVTQKRVRFEPCCDSNFQMLPAESLPKDCIPVQVSKDDYFYSQFNVSCLGFNRATPVEGKTCLKYPREQTNNVSHVMDGSVIYGSDEKTARAMRSFVGGKLKVDMSRDGRPFLTNDSNPKFPCAISANESKCYFAGDERTNQHPVLVMLITALMRLHNYLCDQMAVINPYWDDETVYQEVRRIVWAFLQHVTFKHYLPTVLGLQFVKQKGLLKEGHCINSHDPEINPATYHEFAGAAFRSFHSLTDRKFAFVDKNFKQNGYLLMDNHFLKPTIVEKGRAFDELMRGIAEQPCQKMDQHITVGLTNYLFKQGDFGNDLEVFDIMSGRDMGLPPYVKMRFLCDHREVKDFDDLEDVMDKASIDKLRGQYSCVDDIDTFVGGIYEKVIPGTMVGATFQCIIGEQFYHYMKGDRFYYENCGLPWSFTPEQIRAIRKTSIAWLFCVTGDNLQHIQLDTFHKPSMYNPIQPCHEIPHLDLTWWIDFVGRTWK